MILSDPRPCYTQAEDLCVEWLPASTAFDDIGTRLVLLLVPCGLPHAMTRRLTMPRPNHAIPPIANRLLAALPRNSYKRLEPSLSAVSLELGQVVDTPKRSSRFVYFPTTAVLSMLCTMENGAMVEIGMVGNEGATAMATC